MPPFPTWPMFPTPPTPADIALLLEENYLIVRGRLESLPDTLGLLPFNLTIPPLMPIIALLSCY